MEPTADRWVLRVAAARRAHDRIPVGPYCPRSGGGRWCFQAAVAAGSAGPAGQDETSARLDAAVLTMRAGADLPSVCQNARPVSESLRAGLVCGRVHAAVDDCPALTRTGRVARCGPGGDETRPAPNRPTHACRHDSRARRAHPVAWSMQALLTCACSTPRRLSVDGIGVVATDLPSPTAGLAGRLPTPPRFAIPSIRACREHAWMPCSASANGRWSTVAARTPAYHPQDHARRPRAPRYAATTHSVVILRSVTPRRGARRPGSTESVRTSTSPCPR